MKSNANIYSEWLSDQKHQALNIQKLGKKDIFSGQDKHIGIDYAKVYPKPNVSNQWFLIVFFFGVRRISDFFLTKLNELQKQNFKIIDNNDHTFRDVDIKSVNQYEWLFNFNVCDGELVTGIGTVSKCLVTSFAKNNVALPDHAWIEPYKLGWRIYSGRKNQSLSFGDYILKKDLDSIVCFVIKPCLTITLCSNEETNNRHSPQTLSDNLSDKRVLRIIDSHRLMPFYDSVSFRLRQETESDPMDMPTSNAVGIDKASINTPIINNLDTEYEGFRKIMLDRIASAAPTWSINDPADTLVAVLEALSFAADYYEYFQDSVGTEAYLGTARQRISVSRIARFLDYPVDQGSNSQTLVSILIEPTCKNHVLIPKGTGFFTRFPGLSNNQVVFSSESILKLTNDDISVFESCESVYCLSNLNAIEIYTRLQENFVLPMGSTHVSLCIDNNSDSASLLIPGKKLIFEQVIDPENGNSDSDSVNIALRHCITIQKVSQQHKYSNQAINIFRIMWNASESLPFDLTVCKVIEGTFYNNMTIVRGNIVPVDYGITYHDTGRVYILDKNSDQIKLDRGNICFARDGVWETGTDIVAQVKLSSDSGKWIAVYDLYEAGPLDQVFEVEVDNEGFSYIRFGDGINGMKPVPGTKFTASYRVGNGAQGNVGRNTLDCILSNRLPEKKILKLTNPLPATGGADCEKIDVIKALAQDYSKTQERCVTDGDYCRYAMKFRDIIQVKISRTWTGSWYSVVCYLQRKCSRDVTKAFRKDFLNYMKPYLLIGVDLRAQGPRLVALDIILDVAITAEANWSDVLENLNQVFLGCSQLNTAGYFSDGNLQFGQSIYLSDIINLAVSIDGVCAINPISFKRSCHGSEIFSKESTFNRCVFNSTAIHLREYEIAVVSDGSQGPARGKIRFKRWLR